MSETNQAIETYEAHKKMCNLPYGQCAECSRLAKIMTLSVIDFEGIGCYKRNEKEVKHE